MLKVPDDLVNESSLVSKTDKYGKIIYVNQKFCELSEYSESELIGVDHSIVNSGFHPRDLWENMYWVTLKEKKIWNQIVTNKSKNNKLYHVDTFIKAEFDDNGELLGFISVRKDVTELIDSLNELGRKNAYLEHAAKILRHDMHSGINTYIPRGISALTRRLNPELIERYKLDPPIRMLKEGLLHTQKVYRGVREFTNLVKEGNKLEKSAFNLREILVNYLATTSYKDQVAIDWLPEVEVNEPLFCTAIDNLIRNGLKYNDSPSKIVIVAMEDDFHLIVQDNGRGMDEEDFLKYSKPYSRKENQKEKGTGLGLSIALAIMQEHSFKVSCVKLETGTKIRVRIR